ncbi:MAG: ATP-binding protein [Mogibacterium sp.]|nr:ATP-binding protein [Mogibacterium sp.]MBQ6499960.1 ATP-binding protein [Mogibacterium sp.]
MIRKLMFRLLPVQIILMATSTINMLVSSYFASNFVGTEAMGAVGLYGPLNTFFCAVSQLFVGGSAILCGEYLGKNDQEKLHGTYSLDLIISTLAGILFTVIVLLLAVFDLTGFLTSDAAVRPLLNQYMIGQSIGIIPLILSNQYASFLFVENKGRITQLAVAVYIAVNLVLNYLFVGVMNLQAFGLALASSVGMWVFLTVEAWVFVSGRSQLRFTLKKPAPGEIRSLIRIGLPGALVNGYQTFRGLAVNALLTAYVGTVAISAFATANNLMSLFWAVPAGMQAVSRMLFSVSLGEEDRHSLAEVMRVNIRRYTPVMCVISALIIICAQPLTHIFYKDPSDPVYMMTVWGLRILPLCPVLGIICMAYTSYAQAAGKQRFVHILTIFDGVISVSAATAILIPFIGMNSIYIANVINGIVSILIIIIYATKMNGHFPRNMDELMVIPDSFGACEDEYTEISVRNIDEAVSISLHVQEFCLSKGIDRRRSYYGGLAAEEMVVNVIDHGFTKDKKDHSVDVRVVCKDDEVILRIKDDCVPFNPEERNHLTEGVDEASNIGIRMIYSIAKNIKYQNLFGLNVLTIRI